MLLLLWMSRTVAMSDNPGGSIIFQWLERIGTLLMAVSMCGVRAHVASPTHA